jgi:hypothetical protein
MCEIFNYISKLSGSGLPTCIIDSFIVFASLPVQMECLVNMQNINVEIWIARGEMRLLTAFIAVTVDILKRSERHFKWSVADTKWKVSLGQSTVFCAYIFIIVIDVCSLLLEYTVITFMFIFVGLCSQQYWRQSCCWVPRYESRGSEEEICF